MRLAKSFTLEQSVLEEVERTKGGNSTSERVNELLKRALEQERIAELEREAREFYSVANRTDRIEARAFQKAARRTLTRD